MFPCDERNCNPPDTQFADIFLARSPHYGACDRGGRKAAFSRLAPKAGRAIENLQTGRGARGEPPMPEDFWRTRRSSTPTPDDKPSRTACSCNWGPGYQGDPWMPAMVAEAGFHYPVAMTTTAFCRYVSPVEGDDRSWPPAKTSKAGCGTYCGCSRRQSDAPRPRAPSCTLACEWYPMFRQTMPSPTRQGPRSCISRPCAGQMTMATQACSADRGVGTDRQPTRQRGAQRMSLASSTCPSG